MPSTNGCASRSSLFSDGFKILSRRISFGPLLLLFAAALFTYSPASAEDLWSDDFVETPSSSCLRHLRAGHGGQTLAKEIRDFRALAEESLSLRAVTIKVGRDLKEKAEAGLPLNGHDLDLLGKGLAMHLDLRERLMAVAESHECWLDLDENKLREEGLSPQERLEGVMLSLAAALLLYDNYLYNAALFEGDAKLRYLLNEGDRGYQVDKIELAKVTLSYNSIVNRARVRRAMRFYEEATAAGKGAGRDPYLAAVIEQSPSYDMVRRWSPLYVLSRKLGALGDVTVDSIRTLEREGVSLFSMLFGNTVGLVETRKGKLYGKGLSEDLRRNLRCGDILLEKTPFRLTDKLIPGYWGHAAIWLGTEEELRKLGLWDHPLVVRRHKEIRGGRLVVEALRSGVVMNSLEHFLNIDSLGVLRRPNLDEATRRRIVLQTLRQVDKPYDFNFDVESLDRVYCSKLVYLAYHGVDWPLDEALGRTTISPDHVAQGALKEKDLDLVVFYHDGKPVEERPTATMASLMGVETKPGRRQLPGPVIDH